MRHLFRPKIALAAALLLLVGAFFFFDLHHFFIFEVIKGYQVEARHFYQARPLTAIAAFFLVYLLVVALSLPGGALLGLLAGAVFGVLVGTVVISFASTLAATLACALSRYLFRDLVRSRFPQALATVDRGITREGAFYLFSLRLIPAVPFFVINLVMGLTAIPLRTFYWVSQVGMLAGTLVFVNAGSELGRLTSTADIFSPRLLLAFALLGLLPLVAKKVLDYYRTKTGKVAAPPAVVDHAALALPFSDGLAAAATKLKDDCTACGACVRRCAFLQGCGQPGELAAALLAGRSAGIEPFACSLCNLCTAVCPEKLEPGAFFLELRREAAARQAVDWSHYRTILGYEARGNSPFFAWQGLPAGGDTVFFPGCTLPGTREEATFSLFKRLQNLIPKLGVVLACCAKPSHDLGRQQEFAQTFGKLQQELLALGVKEVVVACPNCYKVFNQHVGKYVGQYVGQYGGQHGGQYGGELKVRSAWELLAAAPADDAVVAAPTPGRAALPVTVHDPCPLRDLIGQQDAVRELLRRQAGVVIEEMKASRGKTLCCGEGGAVGFVRRELAQTWGRIRREQAGERLVLTSCAGCAGFLKRAGLRIIHLADLLHDPAAALQGKTAPATAPWTYLHRLRLKKRLQKELGR